MSQTHTRMHVYTDIHIHTHMLISIVCLSVAARSSVYIYIYIYRARERESQREKYTCTKMHQDIGLSEVYILHSEEDYIYMEDYIYIWRIYRCVYQQQDVGLSEKDFAKPNAHLPTAREGRHLTHTHTHTHTQTHFLKIQCPNIFTVPYKVTK
jgi:hypothetical protein